MVQNATHRPGLDSTPGEKEFFPPPNLRVGVIGCGRVATSFHLPAYLALPDLCQLAAVADPVGAQLETAGEAFGLSRADRHRDANELLQRPDIDVVDLCTPPRLRAEYIVRAAESGKHILAEKPLAATPREARRAVDAAASAGVTIGMMHNYLFMPELVRTQGIVRSGELGTIRAVTVNFLGVPDWTGSGKAEFDLAWRHNLEAGGGVLTDMLHAVYVAEALLDTHFSSASAYVASSVTDAQVEDIALCRFEAADRAALVNVGWGVGPGGVNVIGSRKRLAIEYEHGGTPPWSRFERMTIADLDGTIVEPLSRGMERVDLQTTAVRAVVQDFLGAVRSGREPRATGEDGLRILEAILAAYQSASVGSVIRLPLDQTSPVWDRGILGLADADVADWSSVARNNLFGVKGNELSNHRWPEQPRPSNNRPEVRE